MIRLQTHDLTIGYRKNRAESVVLRDLNASLSSGMLVCLLGINGSGKSTLLRTLAGFQEVLAGTVEVDGLDIQTLKIRDRAKRMSVVLTHNEIPAKITVREVVSLGRYPYTNWLATLTGADEEMISKAIHLTGLDSIENEAYNELSDGQMQKVILARALAQDTSIIFLDEPTNHLDIGNRAEMFQLLKGLASNQNKSIVLSTHDLNLACQMADVLWVIIGQKLVAGSPENLMISGILEQAFPYQGIDLITGHFVRKPELGRFLVKGPDHLRRITEMGLTRLGYEISQSAADRIEISETNPAVWKLSQDGESREFTDIDELMQHLEGN